MSWATAKKALSFFLDSQTSASRRLPVKFFGGETFLRFDVMSPIINWANAYYTNRGIEFDVTTNGSLLKKEHTRFFNENPNVRLWISYYFEQNKFFDRMAKIMPGAGINLTVYPQKVENFFDSFKELFNLGFWRFNFLPAYFMRWSTQELCRLTLEFDKIADFIVKKCKQGHKIEVKNAYVWSQTPLFNNGMVVDCNGDIFLNNLFLSRLFFSLRDELKIGNIRHADKIRWDMLFDFNQIISTNTRPDILSSTLEADKILTNFVNKLN